MEGLLEMIILRHNELSILERLSSSRRVLYQRFHYILVREALNEGSSASIPTSTYDGLRTAHGIEFPSVSRVTGHM